VNHDDAPDYEAMAAGLDRWRQVPTEVLRDVVMRRGLCLWGLWPPAEPDWDECAGSDVRSTQGALPALPLVGFPGSPPEPGVRLTAHRALHKFR
jgi:hypothetical protein